MSILYIYKFVDISGPEKQMCLTQYGYNMIVNLLIQLYMGFVTHLLHKFIAVAWLIAVTGASISGGVACLHLEHNRPCRYIYIYFPFIKRTKNHCFIDADEWV